MLEAVKKAGVVGAGGAGFPTHVKLNAKAEYLLVNGAECEPLLRVDQELMYKNADEVLEGLRAAIKITEAKKGIICLKGKYKKAIKALEAGIREDDNIELNLLRNVYPAGDEQYIVYNATGRIVPEGGIPLNVGVVVTNVETLLNVGNAIKGQPMVDKYVTIAGAVREPKTFKVPVGTPLSWLIAACGGVTTDAYRVIDGGPMMGKLLEGNETYVKKQSKGYIVLPEDAGWVKSKEKDMAQMMKEAKTACCHCNLCTEMCPRNLLGHNLHPSKLMRIAGYGTLGEKNVSLDEAYLCCECGLCEIACVMNLQPWKLNQLLKAQLKEAGVKNSNTNQNPEANPFYEYREFPVSKLVYRLGLDRYDVPAPITDESIQPDHVRIFSVEHIGAPGKCVVSEGQAVEVGDLVYEAPEKALGANIHASISGKVSLVSDTYVEIRR